MESQLHLNIKIYMCDILLKTINYYALSVKETNFYIFIFITHRIVWVRHRGKRKIFIDQLLPYCVSYEQRLNYNQCGSTKEIIIQRQLLLLTRVMKIDNV